MQSRISLGLAALGRPAYINLGRAGELPADRTVEAMRASAHAVLDEAYARGVRWVDVARSYGLAEHFLADWLATRGHADLTVSSKWGYAYVGDWRLHAGVHESKEHSLAQFSAQWKESSAVLGAAINLYQVHSLTPDSPLFGDRRLLSALAALADSGVRTGFSTSGPRQREAIERGLALEVDGRRVFTAVQATWNVLETSAGSALADAHADGNLVLLKETVANGRLAVTAPDSVRTVADGHGVSPDAVAVAAALAVPWADAVLIGPASTAQLRANLAGEAVRLADDDQRLLANVRELPETYWATRSALQWC